MCSSLLSRDAEDRRTGDTTPEEQEEVVATVQDAEINLLQSGELR